MGMISYDSYPFFVPKDQKKIKVLVPEKYDGRHYINGIFSIFLLVQEKIYNAYIICDKM